MIFLELFKSHVIYTTIVMYMGLSIEYPMKKVEMLLQNHIEIDNIRGFFIRRVTKFGNSAKLDCPKK